MIIPKTKVVVADNSGARFATCISTLNGKSAAAGRCIVVSVQSCKPHGSVKSGDVCLAVVIRTVKDIVNNLGFRVNFGDNAVVLLDKDKNMIGTRVFGPVSSILKNHDEYSKIISLACEVI